MCTHFQDKFASDCLVIERPERSESTLLIPMGSTTCVHQKRQKSNLITSKLIAAQEEIKGIRKSGVWQGLKIHCKHRGPARGSRACQRVQGLPEVPDNLGCNLLHICTIMKSYEVSFSILKGT